MLMKIMMRDKLYFKKIKIEKADTVKIISEKVKIIEHKYYPKVIESLLN